MLRNSGNGMPMWARVVTSGVFLSLGPGAAMAAAAPSGAPVSPQRQLVSANPPISSNAPRVTRRFAHPIALSEAAGILDRHPVEVEEYTFDLGGGIIGGFVMQGGAVGGDIDTMAKSIQSTYGRMPVVTGVTLKADPSSGTASPQPNAEGARALEEAGASQVASIDESRAVQMPRPPEGFPPAAGSGFGAASQTGPAVNATAVRPALALAAAQVFQQHFPSGWASVAVPRYDNLYRPTQNWFVWNQSGFTPSKIPADWGMEIGVSMYNNGIGGVSNLTIRDGCRFTSQDANRSFWAQTYNGDSWYWATNVPNSAAPYPDSTLTLDACTTNSLELGVGYPRNLTTNASYFLASYTSKGTQPENQSTMSAAVSLQSNDCNDGGNAPASWCMGLNVNRASSVAKSQLLVGAWRNWLVPGCFWMTSGWIDPIRSNPGGRVDCPLTVS
jgi:hypothetical protein